MVNIANVLKMLEFIIASDLNIIANMLINFITFCHWTLDLLPVGQLWELATIKPYFFSCLFNFISLLKIFPYVFLQNG